MVKVSIGRIIFSVLAVNIAGLVLRYFEYDTYLIIAGFRFHLSFLIPLLILLPEGIWSKIKHHLAYPVFSRKFIPVIWISFSFGMILLVLFLFEKIELADPEYFYEFGLSSVFDYPIYLIWNFPQFILLFMFISISAGNSKTIFFSIFLLSIFLFLYEFIPLEIFGLQKITVEKLNYIPLIELLLVAIASGIFFQFFSNIYWFAVIFFSVLWFNLLAFGSESEALINMLFAAQYTEWEGFFTVTKEYKPYLLSAQLLFLIIMLLSFIPLRNKKAASAEAPLILKPNQTEN